MARQGKETRDEDRTGKETRGQKEKTGTGKERREDETRTGLRTGEETRGQKKKRGTGKERREKRWREEELANLCSSLSHNEQERRGEKEGGGKKS